MTLHPPQAKPLFQCLSWPKCARKAPQPIAMTTGLLIPTMPKWKAKPLVQQNPWSVDTHKRP
jgi:hypothetical protein